MSWAKAPVLVVLATAVVTAGAAVASSDTSTIETTPVIAAATEAIPHSTDAPSSVPSVVAPPVVAPSVSAPVPASPHCEHPDELDVLFVGNSYTNMHDLPAVVAQLGADAGIRIHAEKVATGGQNFDYHLQRSQTRAAIEGGDWDFVVLQSHSLDPLRNPDGFMRSGRKLAAMVEASGATPVFFETWPRKAGHNLYNYFEPCGGAPDVMFERVADAYAELAKTTGATVVEVGRAWVELGACAPDLDPYARDAAHPGRIGTYLTANVFFAALTNLSPVGNVETQLELRPEVAARVQAVAETVVQPPCSSGHGPAADID